MSERHKWEGSPYGAAGCICAKCGIRQRVTRRQARAWRPAGIRNMVEVEEFSLDSGATWKTLREISGAAMTRPKCSG